MLILFFGCSTNNSNPSNSTSSPSEETGGTVLPSSPAPESEELGTHLVDSVQRPNTPASGSLKEVLGEATGDLDKDGIDEKVLVYNTSRSTDMGTEREIHILKKEKEKWVNWHISQGAVLPSENGGMMGDPFNQVAIENGCIVLRQSGGSRIKWGYTHRFRWQKENWQLIGATVESGTPCVDWETYDYNLSVGVIDYTNEKEYCDQGKKVRSKIIEKLRIIDKIDVLPEMDGFAAGGNVALKAKKREFSY